jgi:primary-amine oxidase
MLVSQPMGAGFKLEGNEVAWQNWSFHVRVDPRVGVVVSTVRWREGDRSRPLLYEGHLSEIFVPYMDPELPWYSNNFLDAGEFSSLNGGLAQPLLAGVDCPEHAVFFDQISTGANGRPGTIERAACLFERVPGDPAWRHREQGVEGRPKRDLVVRFAAVLGNYDYVFDWIFQQDGTIRVAVGSTGIAETKAVTAARAVAAGTNGGNGGSGHAAERPDAYGRFVAPNIVAVNHDHYFNFRLDLDVGGTANSLEVDRLKQVLLPKDHPRRSLWVVEPSVARTESDGRLHHDLAKPALWRVVNPSQSNAQGYPVGVEIHGGSNAQTLLSADDWPRRRAGFIDHHLWVTPYAPGERYAAGDFPTLSQPGEGLPTWTAANRRIENTDIVAWHTLGFHHVVRAEDWPVMPVMWRGFELRPFDFFDRNPALDLPKRP